MEFFHTKTFDKHLKMLTKRFNLLGEAIETLEKVLTVSPTRGTQIPNLGKEVTLPVYKSRVYCRNVRGPRFRVIYAYDKENETIVFLDVYFKGDQDNHDPDVINDYFK